MDIIERLQNINRLKFSFGKADEFFEIFSARINACSMFLPGFGLGVPDNLSMENKLRGIFQQVTNENGTFVFNISGVNIEKARNGFENFDIAEGNNLITEWELSIILSNNDYFENTIFHNGKVEFSKDDTRLFILWN